MGGCGCCVFIYAPRPTEQAGIGMSLENTAVAFGNDTSEATREWTRCALDPAYFLDTYAYILDPSLGRVRFRLYSYQRAVVREMLINWANIILKPRRMGISWLVAGFALWLSIFYLHKNTLIISIKDKTAKRFLEKVKFIYKNLPDFLKPGVRNGDEAKGEIGTTDVIEFGTESRIESIPTSEDAGRSEGLSLLIIDEAAFVRWMDRIWAAAYPTLMNGGMACMLSTANGIGNEFHKLWDKACKRENDFTPLRLYWWDYPGRNEAWHDAQLRNLGADRCAQEVDCDFLASGRPVFDIEEARALEECAPAPLRQGYNGDYLIFNEPDLRRRYVIGADCADGDAKSWQAACVLDRETHLQVASYRSRAPIEEYARVLAEIGAQYNYAVIAVERNNMGAAVLVHLERMYPARLIYAQPTGQESYFVPGGVSAGKRGFFTSSTTKPLIIQNLAAAIRQGESGIQDRRLISELYTYVFEGNTTHAQEGYSDDMVMARAIAQEAIRTTLWAPRDLPVG